MLSSAIHIILAAILCVFTITPPVTHTAAAQQEQLNNNNNSNNPIKHIVVIMQENHSFDNYFGTYPSANGIPENVCMPLDPDEYLPSHIAYNNGKMDGFMLAESENNSTMSYYDNKTIPYYWDLAKHYVLADNFFSSVLSYSLPDHWYAIAGQAPTASIYYGMPQKPTLATPNEKQVEKEYRQESNVTKYNSRLIYEK
jgi:phospholipase C